MASEPIVACFLTQINTAKAILLEKNVTCNTQHGIISEFDKHFTEEFGGNFKEQVLQINQNEPSQVFALAYIAESEEFLKKSMIIRESLRNELVIA